MRPFSSVVLSFAALAAANPSYGPPNENITLTVGAGSSLEGYQLVGFANGTSPFPAFVPAAEAAVSASTFYLFYMDYGLFGWYSLNINFRVDVGSAKYGLDVQSPNGDYTGLMVFIPSTTYGTNIWGPEKTSPAFPWTGNPTDFPFACSDSDGNLQLAIYTPGKQPKNCEQVQLEYKAVV
ncbi:hypothetical protein ONZ43_g6939 [Nemania bipapillata]|uniref:Uncharacterized protein n=1 Tax=Nemania bipapillata TaxID=110536 RepID=A0ACC2HUP0_9PEZI|nr:hypothetical protein ONZ43_g6939 [Nemania bipapillata]